jgi:hypothetical protein
MTDCGRRALTVGAVRSPTSCSIKVATCTGCTAPIDRTPASKELPAGLRVDGPRVRIANIGGEEFEEA